MWGTGCGNCEGNVYSGDRHASVEHTSVRHTSVQVREMSK